MRLLTSLSGIWCPLRYCYSCLHAPPSKLIRIQSGFNPHPDVGYINQFPIRHLHGSGLNARGIMAVSLHNIGKSVGNATYHTLPAIMLTPTFFVTLVKGHQKYFPYTLQTYPLPPPPPPPPPIHNTILVPRNCQTKQA